MIESLFGGSTMIINILGGLGFIVTVAITVWIVWFYIQKMKGQSTTPDEIDTAGEWDGIQEYKNPLPIGWAVTFSGLMIWAAWYWLIGYPLNAYSQIGEWNQETEEYNKQYESVWENADKSTLIRMGESVYLAQCSQCHGLTADGLSGRAADLTIYGDAAHIAYVIENGSKGMGYSGGEMPPADQLGIPASDIRPIANYVANGFSGAGADAYQMHCASCHGADGSGVPTVFPNIRADQGGYGSVEFGVQVLKDGKRGHIGHMPAFEKTGVLTDIQYEAVMNYILSL
jgi:cytochrome c oxidase cbb3-type subunit 3